MQFFYPAKIEYLGYLGQDNFETVAKNIDTFEVIRSELPFPALETLLDGVLG